VFKYLYFINYQTASRRPFFSSLTMKGGDAQERLAGSVKSKHNNRLSLDRKGATYEKDTTLHGTTDGVPCGREANHTLNLFRA